MIEKYNEMYEQYKTDGKPFFFFDDSFYQMHEYCEKNKIMIKIDNLKPKTATITVSIVDYIFVSDGYNDVKELNKQLKHGEHAHKIIIKKTFEPYNARINFLPMDLKFKNKTNINKELPVCIKNFYFDKYRSKIFDLDKVYFF